MRLAQYRSCLCRTLSVLSLLFLGRLAVAAPAHADGIFISAQDRSGGVFGADNRVVYITAGDRVLQYDLETDSMLSPIVLGGHLMGIDLAPDGTTLAVADSTHTADQVWFHIVHLDTGVSEKIYFSSPLGETGTYALAYGSDGRLLITTDCSGSGWLPLRRYDPSTDSAIVLGSVTCGTPLSANANRSVVAFAEPHTTDGRWGRYFVASGELNWSAGVNRPTIGIAANADASEFAIETVAGILVYDATPSLLTSLDESNVGELLHVAYDPLQNRLFGSRLGTAGVSVFQTPSYQEIDSYDVGYVFSEHITGRHSQGQLRTSHDGRLLFVTVDDGVRVLKTDAVRTNTQLEVNAEQLVAGIPVTLRAVVQRISPATGIPSGLVTFNQRASDGTETELASSELGPDGDTSATVILGGNTTELFAKYHGSFDDRFSISNPVGVMVQRAGTSSEIEVIPENPVYGQRLELVGRVVRLDPSSIQHPTGSVQIRDDTALLSYFMLDTSSKLRYGVSRLKVGYHCLDIVYQGDENHLPSTSPSRCVTVSRAEAAIGFESTAEQSGSEIIAAITTRLTALPPGSGTPSGKRSVLCRLDVPWRRTSRWFGASHCACSRSFRLDSPHPCRVFRRLTVQRDKHHTPNQCTSSPVPALTFGSTVEPVISDQTRLSSARLSVRAQNLSRRILLSHDGSAAHLSEHVVATELLSVNSRLQASNYSQRGEEMKRHHPRIIVFCVLAALLVLPAQRTIAAPVAPTSPHGIDGGATLDWHTFFGFSGISGSGRVAVDATGNAYVVGYSHSAWGTPIRPITGDDDVFVVKMDPNGRRLWMTFLGGEDSDYAADVALDEAGNVYVSGISWSAWSCLDAPCTARSQSDSDPSFVAKLDPEGNLLWNTFLGGDRYGTNEIYVSIAVHGTDSVYVTGQGSHTWGTPLRAHAKQDDAFVAGLDSDGNLVWNTFLGGSANDYGNDIATDSLGNVYVVGESNSGWSCDSTPPSCMVEPYYGYDAFVAKLGSNGSLLWNSFLGGTSGDSAYGIAIDDADHLFVTGTSGGSWGDPIRSYTESSYEWGHDDAFVASMDTSGNRIWNTFLGGNSDDEGYAIDVDHRGHVYVAGYSGNSWGTSSSQTYEDAFVAGLDADGNLLWNAILGARDVDIAFGVAADDDDHVLVTGFSEAEWGEPLRPFSGGVSVFVAHLTPIHSNIWLPWAAYH